MEIKKSDDQDFIEIVRDLTAKLKRRPKYAEVKVQLPGLDRVLNTYFNGKFPNLIEAAGPVVIAPDLPPSDEPIEDTIESLTRRTQKRIQHANALKWMPLKIMSNEPIGINWFGDPHLDDNGTNWVLLREHINIIKKTPGMFGANIGDTHNNWVGRLGQLYAHQDTSRDTALKLAEWFVEESGVPWLIWLLGNHDSWNYGSDVMAKITHKVPLSQDWQAQFKLVFPNKREVLIDAAHNHKGHSQWNSLHGQQKASVMGGIAHLYIAGHLHNWALAQNECPWTNRIYHLARVRGYKFVDDYAVKGGFGNQKHGASVVQIVDPTAKSDLNLIRMFADVEEGADYLKFLRKRC